MKVYNRIMLALDHTYYDRQILQFAGSFASMFIPDNLYFLHIEQDLESEDWLAVDGQSDAPLTVPKDERLQQDILLSIEKHFANPHHLTPHVEVLEGKPLTTLLHWERVKKIDLVILGKKKVSEGSGITTTKLARESTSSMLFVPEDCSKTIRKILVPFDFSATSSFALKKALMLAKHNEHVEAVQTLHIYDSPMFDQFMTVQDAENLEGNIVQLKKEAFADFLQDEGLATAGVQPVFVRNERGNVAIQINEFIQQHNIDLVMIGANGHSMISSWLMGSVTEKLLTLQHDVPILVQRIADIR